MVGLETFDWAVVGAYLVLVGAVGYYAAGTQSSPRDYFLGGRSLPWWAATLSIVATETSAVTFIAIPASAYGGDWSAGQLVLGFILGRLFLAFVFVKAFHRREYLTVYGFLAHRFGEGTRSVAGGLFLLGRLVASGVRLYAGCLAVHVASGLPLPWLIVGLGLFGTAFTHIGGIRSVVWTDVILGLTFVAAAAMALAFILDAIPGGLGAITARPDFPEKVRLFRPELSLEDGKTLLAGLLGGFFTTMATHGTDQDIAQRILTCRDSRAGTLSLVGSAVLIGPVFVLFLSVGTALYFFHEMAPPSYPPPENLNHLFPQFITGSLPSGLAGIAMAGLVAALLSSFTSALNALASAAVADFYQPRRPSLSEGQLLAASRNATALFGLALILAALLFIGSQENLFQLALKVFAYFYGGLLGAFLLGILTRRGSDGSVLLGMLLSTPLVLLLQLRELIADPELAPAVIEAALRRIPPGALEALREVPEVAFPYWIVIGTVVAFAVGALRAR